MATESIGAIGGSQIDVNSLASQLVEAEREPLDAQIERATTKVTTQISALGSLMGSLSTFRSALEELKTAGSFASRTVTSSNDTVVTATADSDSVAGSYDLEVKQLAKAHQIASEPFAGGATEEVGTGTLTITVGDESYEVEIGSEDSTLEGIRDAINAAPEPKVRATLVVTTVGTRLMLTAADPGVDNAIEVAQSGGDGGLAQLTYSASTPGNWTEVSPAQNALVRIGGDNGFDATSSTNSFTELVDGVTFDLKSASEGEIVTVSVALDQSSAVTKVKDFAAAYNTLRAQISKLGSYDATTQTAGDMLGDSLLLGIDSQLRRTLSSSTGEGAYQTLASLGVTTQADGTLLVDEAKLTKAVSIDLDAVSNLFGGENGIAAKLYAQVDEQLATGSTIDTRTENLTKEQQVLKERQEDVDARMEVILQKYIRQFTALDTLLSELSTTSSFLTQQLDQIAAMTKGD